MDGNQFTNGIDIQVVDVGPLISTSQKNQKYNFTKYVL
jgi:hypothetical protein